MTAKSRMIRPKMGILLVTSGWFREVGLQGADSDTTRMVEEAASRTISTLSDSMEIVGDGVIFSDAEAEAAAKRYAGRMWTA
jgi:hypothetical protein